MLAKQLHAHRDLAEMVDTKGLEPLPEGTRRASPSDAANLLIDRLLQDAVKVEG